MKTNKSPESPEKIYVQLPSRKWVGRIWNETPIKEGDTPNWKNATNIEYTRTDAFIEKACKWLRKHKDSYAVCDIRTDNMSVTNKLVSDFKKAMKGE